MFNMRLLNFERSDVMAEFYRFFDSTLDDPRKYDAEEFAEYFRQILTDGIFNGGTNLQVTCDGTNMNVKVNEGYGWIKGYLYKVDNLGVDLQLDTADVTYDRIDRIILRWDKVNRYIKAFVLKGIPASIPVPLELTRNDSLYEISLAQVRVIAGKSFIADSEIIDERLDTNVCGLVNSLVQVDTTTMQQEFDNFMAGLQSENYVTQSEFDTQVTGINNKIGDISSLATTDKSSTVNAVNEVKLQADDLDTQMAELAKTEINKGASMIGIHDSGGNFISGNVEGALSELFQSVSNRKTEIATAITDMGQSASGSDTFTQLTIKIRDISKDATAVASNILVGKTAYVNGSKVNGTMSSKGSVTITPGTTNQIIPAGHHNGSGYVIGDVDLIASNIKHGVNVFGVIGEYRPIALESTTGYTAIPTNTMGNVIDFPSVSTVYSGETKVIQFVCKATILNVSLEMRAYRTQIQNIYQQGWNYDLVNITKGIAFTNWSGQRIFLSGSTYDNATLREVNFYEGDTYEISVPGISDETHRGRISSIYCNGVRISPIYIDTNMLKVN